MITQFKIFKSKVNEKWSPFKKKRKNVKNIFIDIERELDEWNCIRDQIRKNIEELEKAKKDLEERMFQNMPKEEQEKLLKRKKEIEDTLKELDPYGEEKWEDDIYGEDTDDEYRERIRKNLELIDDVKDQVKRISRI